MENIKRTLITSALPYANGYLHLGHCAGAYLPADIYARYSRLSTKEILWVCGSDEHGVAITIAAEKEKVMPQEIIDKYHIANKAAFDKFGMTFDIYGRTSFPSHHKTGKEFFSDLLKKGYLTEKEEAQFYDEKANMFLPDRYVEGVCPNCGYDKARGDQCDSCGAYYDQLELKNPKSLVSGETPIVRKTTHWYMRFDMFQEFLEKYIESHSKDWKDNVLQQSRSWLKQGMAERAITRDLDWGVKINDIPEIPAEKSEGKALYVWFEAVLGYISNTRLWAVQQEQDGNGSKEDWKTWWQDDTTRYIAFIGKDNIVFHTLIFPALLHAKGDNYILPDNVPANEFLNLEGQKFSKSRHWSIDLRDFINDFPDNQYTDTLRYTLAMNLPETKDSDFTWKDFQARNNNELAAIFGNFVNRAVQFMLKNFNSEVPTLPDKFKNVHLEWNNLIEYFEKNIITPDQLENLPEIFLKTYSKNDLVMLYSLWNGHKIISKHYEKFKFRDAITETMNVARAANKYFNDEEPWKTFKNDNETCAKTLYICSQVLYSLSVLFAPIIPFSAAKLQAFFGFSARIGQVNYDRNKINIWEKSILTMLPEGLKIKEPVILFNRIEDEVVAAQIAKLAGLHSQISEEKAEEKEAVNLITIDDFKKVQLRTAKVIEAEKVKKSKKLLRLIVEIGNEKRQIVAGIAEHYEAEQLLGKMVVVVYNLEPAKLMGNESNGMLLAANAPDGKLCIVTVENPEIGTNAEVR